MSALAPSARPRGGRARSAQRKANTPMNASMNTPMNALTREESSYSREWRAQVSDALKVSAEKHQQTAIILERLTGQLDEHDARLRALEERPKRQQATVVGVGGLIGQYAYLLIAGMLLWLALAPHVSLH